MKNNIRVSFLFISFILSLFPLIIRAEGNIDYNSGLSFYSYEQDKENRTSLYIPFSKIKGTANNFSLSFDFKIREGNHNFGYIFRLLGEKGTALDLVISELKVAKKLSLIYSAKSILQMDENDESFDIEFDAWNQVRLSISSGRISLSLNGLNKAIDIPNGKFTPRDLYFGTNQDADYFTTDVPPMTIKNIRIFDKEQQEAAFWPLNKHAGDIAYDTHKKRAAIAQHPKWEIDSHYCWEKKQTFTFDVYPNLAFDSISEKLYIAQANKIAIYDVKSDELEYIEDIPGNFAFDSGDQMIYDAEHHQLISYIVGYNKPLYFDLERKRWNSLTHENQRLEFGHHSCVYLPQDSLLVTIGGYGYHQYKGVLMKYAFASNTWEEVDISKTISPRYLGSAGYLGQGKILYFGGYGSESGKQEESPHNYYDLYEIDIHTNEIKKRWEKRLEPGEEHFTNSNSMIIDKERGVFYVLSYINKLYNTRIQIREFSLDSPKERLVGNTIPYTFSDVRSYCNVFLCPKSGKLLAVTTHTKETEGISDVNIYSIAYRPFAEEDVLAQIDPAGENNIAQIIGFIVVLLLLVGIIYILRKRKSNSLSPVKDQIETDEDKRGQLPLDIDRNEEPAMEIIPSSIILLGGFQVINKEGKDVTRQFSPTVKSLFLLILLSTLKNGKGITSAGLKDILWFDKDDSSARNNRNVNLSRLRPLLQTIGDIEIIDDNRYWSVSLGKDVYCDYQLLLAISSKINSEPSFNRSLFSEFLRIVSQGLFLPNTHAEWLDSYKSEYSSTLIEFLLKVSQWSEVQNDNELLIRIGDIILLHDTIDEDGIRLKCYGLYHSNKKGKALQCYNKFCEDYKSLLNEDYKVEFNELVRK